MCRYITDSLSNIKRLDECKYDGILLFNSKSNSDVHFVKRLLVELEGGEFNTPINIENPETRVCLYLRLVVSSQLTLVRVNFTLGNYELVRIALAPTT